MFFVQLSFKIKLQKIGSSFVPIIFIARVKYVTEKINIPGASFSELTQSTLTMVKKFLFSGMYSITKLTNKLMNRVN